MNNQQILKELRHIMRTLADRSDKAWYRIDVAVEELGYLIQDIESNKENPNENDQ